MQVSMVGEAVEMRGGGWSSGIGVAFEDFCFFLVTFATLRTGK